MNYIYLLNNLWQNVIHKEGYKHTYLVVYLSLVDSCNRFNWNDTPISIDVNLAKTKVSKKIFYEAIGWLVKNNLIQYRSGKNAYTIAHYKIIEVQKSTTTNTTIDTTAYTTTDTTTLPQVAPIILNNKPKNKKRIVFSAPSQLEVETYFVENNYKREAGIRAWKYYNESNWEDSKGNKVRNWKQKMQGVWFKEENEIKTSQGGSQLQGWL